MLLSRARQPSLRVTRPTPTTVSFTVSTRSERQTIAAHVLHFVISWLRITIGLILVILTAVKWRQIYPLSSSTHLRFPPGIFSFGTSWPLWRWLTTIFADAEKILGPVVFGIASRFVDRIEWLYYAPSAAAVLWGILRRGYQGEIERQRAYCHVVNLFLFF